MKKIEKHLPIIAFIFLLLMVHRFIMVNGDDFASYIYRGEGFSEKIRHLIFDRWNEYKDWNSRFPILTLNSFLLMTRENIAWKILNPFVIASIVYSIFYLVKARYPFDKKDWYITSFIMALLMIYPLEMKAQTFFWQNGSIHYLWSSAYILFFIKTYTDMINGKKMIHSKFALFYHFILALLAGWLNENITLVAFGVVLFTIILNYIKYKKISLISILGFFGLMIGMYFLFINSNGQSKRLQMHMYDIWNNYSSFEKIAYGSGVFIYLQFIKYYLIKVILRISENWPASSL